MGLPAGPGPRIVNLEQWAWHIIDAVRAESVRNPDDRLRRPAADLTEPAPARPRESPVHPGFAVLLRLRAAGPGDDRELMLITMLTHFGTATDVTVAELRLEAFLPTAATAPSAAP